MWVKNITKHNFFFKCYTPNMTDLRMLGNSFCKLGLVSTYQRFSAAFLPKSSPFEKRFWTSWIVNFSTALSGEPVRSHDVWTPPFQYMIYSTMTFTFSYQKADIYMSVEISAARYTNLNGIADKCIRKQWKCYEDSIFIV